MRKALLTLALTVGLALAGGVATQASPAASGLFWYDMNVSELPAACTEGQTFVIKDGNAVDDCATGGGAFLVACQCDTGGVSYIAGMRTTGQGLADVGTANEMEFKYTDTLAADPAFAAEECVWSADGAGGGGILCEGTTPNTNEQLYLFPAADGADTTEFIAVDSTSVTNLDGDGLAIGAGDLDVGAGTGIAVAADTVAFDYTDAGADPALATEECRFSNEGASAGGWVCEGATANTIETRFRVTDPTSADRIVTFPDADTATGVAITCTGDDKISAFNATTGIFTCSTDQTGAGSNGFGTIGNAVADVANDTLTVTNGIGVQITTTDDPEDLSPDFLYTATLAADPALNAEECVLSTDGAGGGSVLCEGTAANTNEQLYLFPAVDGVDTTNFIAVDDKQVTDLEGAGLSITAGVLNASADVLYDVNQTTHGFSVGDVVNWNGSTWAQADADNSLPCTAIVTAVAGANDFTAAGSGTHTITTHGFTLGTNYLSTTAGGVSSTDAGPGNIIQQVLHAVDANTVILQIGTPLS
jgi:hypothetical protein